LIVGAGISGIGTAYHLREQCAETSFVILDSEASYGGTWWTHRSPGTRSDSDLHTFGYSFKPWVGPPIATAQEILSYLGEVIEENELDQNICYRHKVLSANWSSSQNTWTVEVQRLDTDKLLTFSCNFLSMCQEYYRHNEGFTPEWEGMAQFKGQIAHPENWPDDVDHSDKQVVVIGSGATAATVVPAMASSARHVTMLQRSAAFFATGRNAIELTETLRELQIDESWIHEITRRKILFDQSAFTKKCLEHPDDVKDFLLDELRKILGPDYDIDKHFTPSYRPWRQRIAFVPNADLFRSIADGDATVVTDKIARFTENGILLQSGQELAADLIVTATGFNMNVMGDIAFSIDGEQLDFSETITYRGTMFSGVPNLAWVLGYFRASWTLRSEIIAEFVCRLINHMRDTDALSVEPQPRASELDMPRMSWLDEEDFNPNYLRRAEGILPKRGPTQEWQHTQDYWHDKDEFPAIDLNDDVFVYRRTSSAEERT
jgi:cation diffusion facilitator CzcD-associated flavoprotein CzcO